jgi:DNA-nicking Smr family endonuclease
MFFDLNIPITAPASLKYNSNTSKKKGKQKALSGEQPDQSSVDLFSASQVEAVEKRIDILVHCESIHNV